MSDLLKSFVLSVDLRAASGIVFGATISALVSYVLQRNQFKEAKRQKEDDRFEDRKALGLNVLTKMMRIASTLEILRRSIAESYARANKEGIKGPPWTFVSPIASQSAKVRFEPEELTEIMRLDAQLFNDLGPFDDVHNVLLDTFELYKTERNALTDQLPADMKGALGTTILTAEQMKRLAPKMASLDVLIAGMDQRATADSAEAWQLLVRLQDALNKTFDLKLKLERKELVHQGQPGGAPAV